MLVWQRLLTVLVGTVIITLAAVTGLVVGALAVGADVSATGLLRLVAVTRFLGAAMSAVTSIVRGGSVAKHARRDCAVDLRRGLYLVVYLVPLFAWPDWVARLSFLVHTATRTSSYAHSVGPQCCSPWR